MDMRKEFMQRLAAGERMTDLCREYGISRKTGHKFKQPSVGQVALSNALAGERVGIREGRDGRWLINFCGVDLGHAGPHRRSFTPLAAAKSAAASGGA